MEKRIVFADEHAQKTWKLLQKVRSVSKNLPSENSLMKACRIRFSAKNSLIGFSVVLLSAGNATFLPNDRYVVSERVVMILKKMHVPFIQEASS